MKERPILFSGPMVRAILAGTKTQTRRVVKPQPDHCHRDIIDKPKPWSKQDWDRLIPQIGDKQIPCPYGTPGGRLWVRETWAWATGPVDDEPPSAENSAFVYRASWGPDLISLDGLWKPSIHMPRIASRISLEITGVRVERVQEISERDAIAEGVEEIHHPGGVGRCWKTYDPKFESHSASARDSFASLWNCINGSRPNCVWADNPWVWVMEFRRIPQ